MAVRYVNPRHYSCLSACQLNIMIRPEEVYRIGRIGKAHGVKGEVTFMFSDDVFDRVDSDYLILSIDGILVPFFFEEYRFKNNDTALVKFCDVDDKSEAQELTGCDVYFPKKLSDRGEDEFTLGEFEGFTVINAGAGDKLIGTVSYVDDATENVLFGVRTPDGADVLIPANDDFITGVDTVNREIRVELPEGLLDLN